MHVRFPLFATLNRRSSVIYSTYLMYRYPRMAYIRFRFGTCGRSVGPMSVTHATIILWKYVIDAAAGRQHPLILALATEYALMVCLNNMRCMQMTGSGLHSSGVEGRC